MDANSERRFDTIDHNLEKISAQLEQALHGTAEAPGLVVKVDRLERDAERRKFHIRALWTAFLAAVSKFAIDQFR